MKQAIATMPTVHITNYQQYIAPAILTQSIYDNLPSDSELPEHLHASIAYIKMDRKAGIFITTLVLSIKGKAYKFKLTHNNELQYAAWVTTLEFKQPQDADIRLFQQAFEAVVIKNIKQIVKAITTAYGHK